ncbi:hypothetical protein CLAIMM_15113 [Cladophialophora immunda]|nr:hypothetical protein CLAIMM_15113 [Cladophialophora immunda]
MATPSAPYRRPTSLEQTRVFIAVVAACEPVQNHRPYKQVTLVRLTYEQARSEASRNNFLCFFFQHTKIPADALPSESISASEYGPRLIAFAETLFENFFLPLRASARKAAQPSPAAFTDLPSAHLLAATTRRLANLRRDCLVRDHHRCVISRSFDCDEATSRIFQDGTYGAQDDEGTPLRNKSNTFTTLEVAHILPHSLTTFSSGEQELVDESKRKALAILDMFDDGVVRLIEGSDIDRTRNAITLTMRFHRLFSRFQVYFERQGNQLYAYRIDPVRDNFVRRSILSIESRTLFTTGAKTIDPPSARFLAVHAAIARVLYLSGAGRHIDKILYDLDHKNVMADGSTQLGYFTALRLGGWWDGRVGGY